VTEERKRRFAHVEVPDLDTSARVLSSPHSSSSSGEGLSSGGSLRIDSIAARVVVCIFVAVGVDQSGIVRDGT